MIASELKLTLKEFVKNQMPLLIVGSPGIGKSDIVMSVANELNIECVISHPVVSDPTDYKGMPFVFSEKEHTVAEFIPFGDLNKLINTTTPILYFIDDIGQAPVSVQAALMQLILARQVNGHKISDKVTFVAATNKSSDKAGVSNILEPVKSRFSSIIELTVSVNDWLAWAEENNLDRTLISFIRFRPSYLNSFIPTREIINSPSPRTIASVSKILNLNLPAEIKMEAVSGAVGKAFANEFKAYLDIIASLPTIDDILKNPSTVNISSDAGSIFAICDMISYFINESNIDTLLVFASRLNKEVCVALLRNCAEKNPNLLKNRSYLDFAKKFKSLLI